MTEVRELDFHGPERVNALRALMREARHGAVATWMHRRLRRVFSDFDVNALLGMYPMTFLSTDEWRTIAPDVHGRLLDVGAGSGDLTRALAPLFDEVVCTETSRGMARKLSRAGFTTHRVDLSTQSLPGSASFDVVSLLHVLDRCDAPLTLFDRALSHAHAGATIIVAVPLPYDPLVDKGSRTIEPRERLVDAHIKDVAKARAQIEERLFTSRGLQLQTIARAPYLCPGDAQVPSYSLNSFVFVARV